MSCALFQRPGSGSVRPSASADPPGADVPPSASVPQALPDPMHPLTHRVGEEVRIPDGTIVYLGLSEAAGEIVARFQVTEGALPSSARVITAEGELLRLTPIGNLLESEPFGDASRPPSMDAVLTLVIGGILIAFDAGTLD